MPRQALDVPEDLPREVSRQVAFGKREYEVPGVPNEAPAGFEEPLLETGQGPASDGERQDEPAEQIAQVVRDHPEEQPHLIGPEPVTGEAGPVGRGLAFLDPLLGRPALVVEADDCSVRPHRRGDDEA